VGESLKSEKIATNQIFTNSIKAKDKTLHIKSNIEISNPISIKTKILAAKEIFY